MSNLRVGILMLLGLGSAGTFRYYLAQADKAPESSYILHAVFKDASGLSVASRVRIAGIDVGHIDGVELKGDQARLTLRLRKGLEVFTDAKVSKRPEGILGTNNIDIVPGNEASGRLPTGAEIANVDNGNALDDMTETLSSTAHDIQLLSEEIRVLARSVRQFVAGEKGKEAPLERLTNMIIKEINGLSGTSQKLLRSLDGVVRTNSESLTRAMASLSSVATNLERLSGAQTTNVEAIIGNVASATKALDRIMREVEQLTGSEGDDVRGLAATLRSSVDSLAKASAELEKLASLAASGKGPVGRLIGDEALGQEIDSAIRGVSTAVASFDRLKTEVELGGAWRADSGAGRAGMRVNLLTKPDKGYILALTADSRVSPSVTTVGENGVITTTETLTDEFRLSAQFWKRFGVVGLRAGLIDGRGGVGLDAYLLGDRVRLQLDAFDFDRQVADLALAPRHRASLDLQILKNVYLTAGVDDPGLGELRDFYFGAGVRFLDPDLKSVMMVAPAP